MYQKKHHRLFLGLLCALLLAGTCWYVIPQVMPALSWHYAAFTGRRQRGPALQPGDTIGVIAPASHALNDELPAEVALLEAMGYHVKLGASATAEGTYLAGTDAVRAKDMNDFFADDSVKAILCLRGGYGSARLLGLLDYDTIAKHPKLFIGYSDITALHTVLGERCQLVTVHGPMLTSLTHATTAYTLYQFEEGLVRTSPPGNVSLPAGDILTTLVPGTAEGRLAGGNITILASLAGTPYELKGDGAILFLEDTDESPYKLDRDLLQLYQNGLLSRVKAIVFGNFPDSDSDRNDDPELAAIIAHYAKLSGKPAIKGLPAGHTRDNMFLPLGIPARVTANADGTAQLEILESAAR